MRFGSPGDRILQLAEVSLALNTSCGVRVAPPALTGKG